MHRCIADRFYLACRQTTGVKEDICMSVKTTGFTVKDAATIGIFCAIIFVVFMAYSMLTGAFMFYTMLFNAAGAAVILAPFYVYMCMKVGKHGPALCIRYTEPSDSSSVTAWRTVMRLVP